MNPTVFETTAFTPPKYGPGHEVYVAKYSGVLSAEDAKDYSAKFPREVRLKRVESLRLIAERSEQFEEDSDGGYNQLPDAITYPKGWEYLLTDAITGGEWGWVTELELSKAGY